MLGQEPPFDILSLCRHFGIENHARPMPKELSGFLLNRQGRHYIVVNSRHRRSRRRFSAAHELYHFFEHRWLMIPVSYMIAEPSDDPEAARREAEANAFAAELLAPKHWVRYEWSRYRRIPALAEVFGLSVAATTNRVEELGLWRRRLQRRILGGG